MRKALEIGTVLGVLFGAAECAAARAVGLGDPVLQAAAHVVLAVVAAALLWAVLRGFLPQPERWTALLLAAGILAAVAFCRIRLHWVRPHWSPGEYLLLLAGCALAGGLAVLGVAALASRWLPRFWRHRPGAGESAVLVLVLAGCGAVSLRLAGPFGVSLPAVDPAGATLPCNVLLITVDTCRRDHLSHYGYGRPTSVSLEPFGFTRFEHAVAASNWTKPSTASLLTGTYPSAHTAVDTSSMVPEAVTTLLETLSLAGMATGYCAANPNASGLFALDQGADFSNGDPYRPPHELAGTTIGELWRRGFIHLSEAPDLNRYALGFLRAAEGRRFCLYVHYNDPHTPYDPPASHVYEGYGREEGRLTGPPHDRSAITAANREELVARYDGEIRRSMEAIAALLRELEGQGILDETLVIVTADHGEHFGEHELWVHSNSAYQELVAVPLLVRPPGGSAVPVASVLASHVDVVPTVLDYLDLHAEPGMLDGRSLRPFLESAPAAPGRGVLVECHRNDMWAYREGERKVIVAEPSGTTRVVELYDVEEDPREEHDLAPAEQSRAAELSARGEHEQEGARARAPDHVQRELTPQEIEALRALGYIE